MPRQALDFTTPQPNGKVGDLAPAAFHKIDENFEELYKSWTNAKKKILTTDANGAPVFNDIGTFALEFLAMADQAAALVKLGLGAPTAYGKSILNSADAAAVRALIGLVIGGSSSFFDKVGYVSSSGVMDVGSAIDFHATSGDTSDYNIRIMGDSTSGLLVQRQGGVGRLMYDQNTILGAVGFVNGVPSGAIFQYISGSDGKSFALRFADGTQVCVGVSATLTANGAYGPGYASNVGYTAFPAAFSATPVVMYNTQNHGVGPSMPINDTTASATSASTRIFSYTQNATATYGYTAFGRWI